MVLVHCITLHYIVLCCITLTLFTVYLTFLEPTPGLCWETTGLAPLAAMHLVELHSLGDWMQFRTMAALEAH